MSCPYAHHDGAYVLGALSPPDRVGFEEHLSSCGTCRRSVQQLAGLPGLLARVDPALLEPSPPTPVPEPLLSRLVESVRREQRRRLRVAVAAVAASAAVAALGSWAVTSQLAGDEPAPPAAVETVVPEETMDPVGGTAIRGSLLLEEVGWGTRLGLVCSYPAAYASTRDVEYALFVRTRDGRLQQVATWNSLAGKTMNLTAATAARPAEISAVEVRTATGRPVLRLTS